ncbi:class I SAM-dependent methyltransferase [Desulfobacterales bacterium HSG17]|nr:class I SAM-dependent methyltransferase [Desulfobacterales bacterium HSG17]
MKKKISSESAKGVAAYRMIESIRPEKDRIIYDPYAQLFVEDKPKKWIQSPIRLLFLKFIGNLKFPGFRGALAARSRFMNECIKDYFPDNFQQLVILGAGYDMSAYCFRDVLVEARVFEVDHPNTQKEKVSKIREQIKDVPDNVTYVPVNFDTDDLKDALLTHGYSPLKKTLFLWEGVTYYLEKESIERTLDFIVNNSAKGSKLAFDYFPPEVIDETSTDRLGKVLPQFVKKFGEPFKFGIEKNQIENFLVRHGFFNVHQISSTKMKDIYFNGKNKNRKVSALFNFVCATT